MCAVFTVCGVCGVYWVECLVCVGCAVGCVGGVWGVRGVWGVLCGVWMVLAVVGDGRVVSSLLLLGGVYGWLADGWGWRTVVWCVE